MSQGDVNIAEAIKAAFHRGRLIDVAIVGGSVNGVALMFENDMEEVGTLTIQGGVKTTIGPALVEIKPMANFNVKEYAKKQ